MPDGKGVQDRRASDLRDDREGTYDPLGNQRQPDTSQASPREKAQPGASMQGEPVSAPNVEIPEGLKRQPRGPYSRTKGRGNDDLPKHVPGGKKAEDARDELGFSKKDESRWG